LGRGAGPHRRPNPQPATAGLGRRAAPGAATDLAWAGGGLGRPVAAPASALGGAHGRHPPGRGAPATAAPMCSCGAGGRCRRTRGRSRSNCTALGWRGEASWRGERDSAAAASMAAGGRENCQNEVGFAALTCSRRRRRGGGTLRCGAASWTALHAREVAAAPACGHVGPTGRPQRHPGRGARQPEGAEPPKARVGPQRFAWGGRTPERHGDDTWSSGWARARSRQSTVMTTPGAGFISFTQIQKCITP
jgi:hypothetical protein